MSLPRVVNSPKFGMPLMLFHIRRSMLIAGTVLRIKIYHDLEKRMNDQRPKLKPDERELLVLTTGEQCQDYMQQRHFDYDKLRHFREWLVLLGAQRARGRGDVSGRPEEAVALV